MGCLHALQARRALRRQGPKPDAFIRHIGRDEDGLSRYWRDRFNTPPSTGDLHEAMEQMGRDVLDGVTRRSLP